MSARADFAIALRVASAAAASPVPRHARALAHGAALANERRNQRLERLVDVEGGDSLGDLSWQARWQARWQPRRRSGTRLRVELRVEKPRRSNALQLRELRGIGAPADAIQERDRMSACGRVERRIDRAPASRAFRDQGKCRAAGGRSDEDATGRAGSAQAASSSVTSARGAARAMRGNRCASRRGGRSGDGSVRRMSVSTVCAPLPEDMRRPMAL